MPKFYVRDGQFWLDDQPQFVHAGEFHYFRTPQDQWLHRLELLKTAGFNAVATYIPWLWHQLEEGVSDFDGHSHPMRDLAGFLDLAAEMGFLIIARPGPYIMAETINEGVPPWVFRDYPQTAFVSQDGKIQNIASYLHPDFLACVKEWYQAVFPVLTPRQITHNGQIIMIQLDNEMGMPHWVRNILDINPDTIARFARYLQRIYGSQLSDRYPTGSLLDFLTEGISHPSEPYAVNIVADYRHFYRDYLYEYADFLWAEARANGMDVPPIVNIHGFMNGGKTFPIGLSQLVKVMEMEGMVSATDVYPLFIGEGNFHQLLFVNETTKALQNKDQALFSVEFQSGGNDDFSNSQSSMYDLHSRLCISSGMRAINHYLFFAGENDPILSPVKRHDWGPPVRKDGTLRKHYFRYPKLSSVLNAYGTALTLSQPQTMTTIGYLLDNFMTEVNNAFTQKATTVVAHQREIILCDMIARGLALTHRPFAALELTRSPLDVAQTPTCWVMMEKQCAAKVQQKLVDYVHQGGKLVLVGRMCVHDADHNPCTLLKDAIGIQQIRDDLPFTQSLIRVFQHQDVPAHFVETYTGQFDEVFATRDDDIVGFVKTMGKGRLVMLGAAVPANNLDDLDIVQQMALQIDCPPLFHVSTWADVRLSRGEEGCFLFINNYLDDPIETTIMHENDLLFAGHAICLPARRGYILPIEWQLREDVLIHYVTAEITQIFQNDSMIVLRTESEAFVAELTTTYQCDEAIITNSAKPTRIQVKGRNGEIVLRKQ